jgi:hypothetical protein
MGLAGPARPRVSRETRLLLATIFISMAALWALARIRFPERPVSTNPVPPLLTQLRVPAGFDDLASEVSKLESRLLPSLVPVALSMSLRVRDNVGAMLLPPAGSGGPARAGDPAPIAHDPLSGLSLVSIPGAPAPELTPWTTTQLDRSRFLIAGDVSPPAASLRPVFIGRLQPAGNPAWPGEIWVLPARTGVSPGDFLFSTDGALAGLVIAHAGAPALVPGAALLRAVDALFEHKGTTGGWLGVDVQAQPSTSKPASDSSRGVIIAWVHPEGPAAGKLSVMDVIEAVGGETIESPAQWLVRTARLAPGTPVVVRVGRGAETSEVSLTATTRPPAKESSTLGLTLRTVRRIGVDVVRVAAESSAARAGIREGDLITAIGDIRAPTAGQVTTAFDAAPADRALLVAITRGSAHRILALEKP